jgi:hypothetical protein
MDPEKNSSPSWPVTAGEGHHKVLEGPSLQIRIRSYGKSDMEDHFEYFVIAESAGISIFIPTSCQLNDSKNLTVGHSSTSTFDHRSVVERTHCSHLEPRSQSTIDQ